MKTYNQKGFLAPDSITSSASHHAKVKEDGTAEFRVSDCTKAVRLHNDVNTEEGEKDMQQKLKRLIKGAKGLLQHLDTKPRLSDENSEYIEVAGIMWCRELMSGGDYCYRDEESGIYYYEFNPAQTTAKEQGRRLPTKKEFYQLYNKCETKWSEKRKGMWFKDRENGNKIFFPASGYRLSDTLTNVGSSGFYWSSSAGSSTLGYFLSFGNSSVDPQYSSSRYYDFPVRCVKL